MTKPEESSSPESIYDTDWDVGSEKTDAGEPVVEQTSVEQTLPEQGEIADESSAEDVAVASPSDSGMPAPPPASFEMLVTMFFTQAMAALGQIPNPMTGVAEISKPHAKHYIDTLDIIGEKTKGNLSAEESKMLSEALHALRMMYVNVKQPDK